MKKTYLSKSAQETKNIARNISGDFCVGDIILLDGDLGAGKTVFSSGLVNALTKKEYSVTSPTFAIVNSYSGDLTVHHFDFYRIESPDELENIGIYEYLYDENAICLIEWPSKAEELLSGLRSVVKINIKKIDENTREITIEK